MSTVYGLVGHPVSHSLSPAMHNAAFKALGLDCEYRLFDVPPGSFESFLDGLLLKGIAGVNVTIPHKIAAWGHLSRKGELDSEANTLGSVNTVKVSGSILQGFSTDGAGFSRSVKEDLGFSPERKKICFIGAGGAARAIIMHLGNAPEKIFVYDLAASSATTLKMFYGKRFDDHRLQVVAQADLEQAIGTSDLIVNATPVGMKENDPMPIAEGLLRGNKSVYDIVYNRPETKLVSAARKNGLRAATGLGMLLFQGAIAFEIWTGRIPPVHIMRKALKEEIDTCL
ncbi:MAG: shikimate dehydrogenase [Candidatus Omnitrophota bacterium]